MAAAFRRSSWSAALVIEWGDFSEPWQPARMLHRAVARLDQARPARRRGRFRARGAEASAGNGNGPATSPRARARAAQAPAPPPSRAVDSGHSAFLRPVGPVFHPLLHALSLKERIAMKKKEHVIPSAPVPVPYGAHVVDQGVHFSIFSRHATRVWLLLFDHAEDEAPKEEFELRPDRNRLGDLWHLHVPTARAGPVLRLPHGWPARRRRRPCLRSGPVAAGSLCAGRHRPEEVGRPRGNRSRPADQKRPAVSQGHHPEGRLRLGGRPHAAGAAEPDDHLRSQRARLHRAPERRRRLSGHLPRADRENSAPAGTGHHHARAAADAGIQRDGIAVGERRAQEPAELLGLQHAGLLRAERALRLREPARRTGARVQGDGAGNAQGRHRGHPRRGVQPHRRRRHGRPDLLVPRHRQLHLLHDGGGRAALQELHRLRQHRQRQPPGRARLHPALPALLGAGHARGRLPLRPGHHPRARPQRRPAGESARRSSRSPKIPCCAA